MNLSLAPDIQKRIVERVNSGRFASPEEVVAAAILALDQQEQFGNFQPGELDALLAEGEKSIGKYETLDGDEAFAMRRMRRARKRK
ncbi:MAG TPA: hypothetical protein VKS79_03380 [Gemmataceae bacterium]|nr:hypothetical protein [Gemmataceae bacterium]